MGINIYKPKVIFSKEEKQLIALIAKILVADADTAYGANFGPRLTTLSDEEADELLHLIGLLLNDEHFKSKISFVEGAWGGGRELEAAKGIYLKGLTTMGKSRVMSSQKWQEFLHRLRHGMTPDHFAKMELMLFKNVFLDGFVATDLMIYIQEIQRKGKLPNQNKSDISSVFYRVLGKLDIGERIIERTNIASLGIIISNMSVLFTTRDWSAAGTLSTLYGAMLSLRKE